MRGTFYTISLKRLVLLYTSRDDGLLRELIFAVEKELVEMFGGSIEVDSELGNGTTFWLQLPIA